MNNPLSKSTTSDKFIRSTASGTYQPISKTELRLPKGYSVCSEQDIAARQVSSTFAHVFADAIPDSDLAHASDVAARLKNGQSAPDRIQRIAEEFAQLRD